MALPSHLSYGLKSALPGKVRSETVLFSAMNSTYTGTLNNTVRIDIPQLANAFLDPLYSYLHFTISVAGQNATLDDSAACVINSLAVYSGGQQTLLEQINNYNLLHSMLYTLTSSITDQSFAWNTMSGMSPTTARQGVTINAGQSLTVAIPLVSILGLNSQKMLPMDSGFTLLLGLESPNVALVHAVAGASFSLSDISYVGAIHYLPPEVAQAIKSSSGPQTIIPCTTWRNFSATLTASTQNTAQFGIRASSLKNMLSVLRPAADLNSATANVLTNYVRANTNSYQTLLGSSYTPLRPLTTLPQMFAELTKSLHFFATANPTKITAASYGGAGLGAFILGTDFEGMSRNKSESILGGVSTLGTNNLQISLGHNPASPVVQLDTFFHQDCVLMFAGDQVTVQF